MNKTVNLKCLCGTVEGKVSVVPGSFFHVECLCSDCQQFANHLGISDKILNSYGGTELFQTYPAHMQINSGQDEISCVQLQEKGLYRWHTACCNMPLGNTINSASMPFVGIPVKLMQFADEQEKVSILGPITLKAFGNDSIGEMPNDAHPKFPITYMPKIIFFMLKGWLGKKNAPSPFFQGKHPVAEITNLSQ